MTASTKRGLATAVIILGTIATIRTHGGPRVISWMVAVAAVLWFGMIEES